MSDLDSLLELCYDRLLQDDQANDMIEELCACAKLDLSTPITEK